MKTKCELKINLLPRTNLNDPATGNHWQPGPARFPVRGRKDPEQPPVIPVFTLARSPSLRGLALSSQFTSPWHCCACDTTLIPGLARYDADSRLREFRRDPGLQIDGW